MAKLKPRNVRFGIRDPDLSNHGIFIIFRNNLDEFFYFYNGTNVRASFIQGMYL